MPRTRRRYTLEFKQEAVRLVREEKMSHAQVSEDLGVDRSSISVWCRSAEKGELGGPGKSLPGLTLEEEVAKLRKENRILREEREILKKAAVFFAQESR